MEQHESNLNILLFNSDDNKSDGYQEKLTKNSLNSDDHISLGWILRMT